MDDSCAVCAETLEWVAYGSCGHKDVCSTCVARLRFICNDRRCCICKTESAIIFVTKALGDYTRMISDFSVFPSEPKEGKAGGYWYHEDTQAYFDDVDHYKMIKAMCRLSCSVCDKSSDENPTEGTKKRGKFRNIDQLKGHLFHEHRKMMCSLCLEGRKVFICEQKLYTRAQLNQHINTGDSEVDGTESERGGFMGHPLCEFCRSPFYGDNELYTHMSTEHYTCHLCQRQHPGQYEYYKNYDDLEVHFRQKHFLCEDEACLAKKFIVFLSEAEMKRHNTLQHGGRMSRAKRSAALQIPTSFRYRRSSEQDNRRGRARFQRDLSDAEISRAIEASFETAITEGRSHDSSSSNTPSVSHNGEISGIPIVQPFELLATTDPDPPSRYLQALSQKSRNTPLEEAAFPPLPMAPGGSQQKSNQSESLPRNNMAEKLRRQKNKKVNVLNTGQAWPNATRSPMGPLVNSTPADSATGPSLISDRSKPAAKQKSSVSSLSSSVQSLSLSVQEPSLRSALASSSSWGSTSGISHSTSAPNLVDTASASDFPPVSAVQMSNLPASGQSSRSVEEVYAANKSMVEKIRSALGFDQDKYASFKDISAQYRQGLIDAAMYLVYVEQFGLSHLVLDLARLCPDPQKEKELVDTYNANLIGNGPRQNHRANSSSKGKSVVSENSGSKGSLADSILSTVRELQSNYKPSEEDVEMLSKDGYRRSKGKSTLVVEEARAELSQPSQPLVKLKVENGPSQANGGSNQNSGGDGKTKQRQKKSSKFHKVRLGDGSMAADVDPKTSDFDSGSMEAAADRNKPAAEGLPVRGVWKNGGGLRLLGKTRN